MVSVWLVVGLFVFVGIWASWMLAVERRAHNRTLDRFMAVTETLGAYRAKQEQDGTDLFWQDAATGELRPVVRGRNSGVEDVEGSMFAAGPGVMGSGPV